MRLDVLEQLRRITVFFGRDGCVEADVFDVDALFDDLVNAVKRTAADKEDVGRIDLNALFLRMFASALRRDVGYGAFEELQQRLLNAFPTDVACNRRILAFSGNFIDFIDVDDTVLRALNVVICGLNQAEQDVFNVFADVACFCQRRRVCDCKRNLQRFRKRLRQVCFAAAGRT